MKALTHTEHNHFALQDKPDTTPLITHRFSLSEIEEAYRIFENRPDGVSKVAITAHPSKT